MSYLQCYDPYRYLLRSGRYPLPYPYYYPYVSPAPNLSNEDCGAPSFYGSLPYDCYYNFGAGPYILPENNLSFPLADPCSAINDYCCYDKVPYQDPSIALGFTVERLVSNVPTVSRNLDPNLLDPWGIVIIDDIVWVVNAGSGLITSYDLLGRPLSSVVNVFGPIGNIAQPTGIAPNLNPNAFIIACGQTRAASTFIIATRDGTINGYNPLIDPINSIELVNNSAASSVYTGISVVTIAENIFVQNRKNTVMINTPNVSNSNIINSTSQPIIIETINRSKPITETIPSKNNIYVADFYNGRIDVFDGLLNRVDCYFFIDENSGNPIPESFSPFNIVNINDFLYVTYAKRDPIDNQYVQTGTGLGYISIFSLDGTFIRRFVSCGVLNAPWGLLLAPTLFGYPSGSIMVSNFGDGTINIFNTDGEYVGTLRDQNNNTIYLGGLRGLAMNPNYQKILYWTSNNAGLLNVDNLLNINGCSSNSFVGSINTRLCV
jgi:hypothetical protein